MHSVSEKQIKLIKRTTVQPLQYIKKTKMDLSLRNGCVIQPCALGTVTCIS